MSSTEHDTNRRNEVLGIALFLMGSLPLVLVVLTLVREPGPEAEGVAALAQGLVAAFGAVPVMVLSGGIAGLGGWLFTGGNVEDPVQHLAGIVGCAAGLAVLLGAWEPGLGGNLGARTGGRIAEVSVALGLFVGACLVLLSGWLTWLRGEPAPRKPLEKGNDPATLSDALSEAHEDGVSALETSALVPDEATLERMEELWRQPSTPELHPAAGSPYPEDVRLTGQIPDGARPIGHDPNEPLERATPGPVESPTGTAEAEAGDADGEHLAPGAAADELDPVSLAAVLAEEDAPAKDEAVVLRPTWEEVESSTGEEPAEEPDLADSDPEEALEDADSEEEEDDELAEAEVDEEEASGEELEWDESEEDPDEESEYEEEYEEEEDLEEEDELEEGEEAAEYEGEPEEEEECESEDESEAEHAEDEEEASDDELELDESDEEDPDEESEYEEDSELEENEEVAEFEDESEEECELEDEDAELEEAVEADPEEGAAEEEILEEEIPDQEVAEEEAAVDEPHSEEEDGEPESELEEEASEDTTEVLDATPSLFPDSDASDAATLAPAGSSRKKPATTPDEGGEGSLLQRAGCLFLQEGRVAVSMLQRSFDLDFQAACDLLDDLQEEGLIGPYKGGQQRDILLTLEEWQARTPAS